MVPTKRFHARQFLTTSSHSCCQIILIDCSRRVDLACPRCCALTAVTLVTRAWIKLTWCTTWRVRSSVPSAFRASCRISQDSRVGVSSKMKQSLVNRLMARPVDSTRCDVKCWTKNWRMFVRQQHLIMYKLRGECYVVLQAESEDD